MKDYFNPLAFYRALNIELPAFRYDPDPDAENTRMPEGVPSRLTVEQNAQRVYDNFVNPINFDSALEPIYASDIVMVCPNVPYSMPETYRGADFDIENKWMFEMCVDMVGRRLHPAICLPMENGCWWRQTAICAPCGAAMRATIPSGSSYMAYLVDGKISHFRCTSIR